MYGLIREVYQFPASAKVLARHIYSRMYCGKVIVVTDNPKTLISSLRKHWLKLARKVQVERARTLRGERIKELTAITAKMQTMDFSTQWSQHNFDSDVYVATVEQLLRWPPDCRTLYVACKIELEQLHLISAWMPKNSLVVTYE